MTYDNTGQEHNELVVHDNRADAESDERVRQFLHDDGARARAQRYIREPVTHGHYTAHRP